MTSLNSLRAMLGVTLLAAACGGGDAPPCGDGRSPCVVSIVLPSTTFTIGGASVYADVTLYNPGAEPMDSIGYQFSVRQAEAYRAAGGAGVWCMGPGDGPYEFEVLPPGLCTWNHPAFADNTMAGIGTLVAGPATLEMDLMRGMNVVETFEVPITLLE